MQLRPNIPNHRGPAIPKRVVSSGCCSTKDISGGVMPWLAVVAVVLIATTGLSACSGSPRSQVAISRPRNEVSTKPRPPFTHGSFTKSAPLQVSKWHVVSSPVPPGATENVTNTTISSELESVTCPSSSFCVAVGYTSHGSQGLIETYDGLTWSVNASSSISLGNGDFAGNLSLVSCPTVRFCAAVERYGGEIIWNGSVWSAVSYPPASYGKTWQPQALSCGNSRSCMAVGSVDDGPAPANCEPGFCHPSSVAVAQAWNGSSWSNVVVSLPSGTTGSELYDVQCFADSSCLAVGQGGGNARGFFLKWNGLSWSPLTSSPNVMFTLSCESTFSCIATGIPGSVDEGTPRITLSETWNGSAWSTDSVVPTPGGPNKGFLGGLLSVSCADSCVAIGSTTALGTSGVSEAFMDGWNGVSWSPIPLPKSVADSTLNGVSCTAHFCIAVGSSAAGATLIIKGPPPPAA